MSPGVHSGLRIAVTVAGIVVMLASLDTFRASDWLAYVAYVLVGMAVYMPYVEVLPQVTLPVPWLATTLGFLYIAGPPVIVLSSVPPLLLRILRYFAPESWKERVPQLRAARPGGDLVAEVWENARSGPEAAAEWALFTLGLGARCAVVSLLVPGERGVLHPGVMAVAEVAGYVSWNLLALLPIYSYRVFLAPIPAPRLRPVMQDLGLIFLLGLTPFVFLIAYGYRAHGLAGATMWSLSSLGLHFILKRLHERRVTVEEQNQRLSALNRELEHRERLSAIGKMSSVVSHQILQQLGVIGLHADLIHQADGHASPADKSEQMRRSAEAIEDALRGVNGVLRDLLVFSKDLRVNVYEHALDAVVAETVDACSAEADARGVALRVEMPASVSVVFDKLKVTQALANVVRNAVEASPPGGTVTVRAAVRDDTVELRVTDAGPGVRATDHEAVFAPFFTTKEQGTGLGLAIARAFVEAHGGSIVVESPGGQGATFVLRLPLRGPEDQRAKDPLSLSARRTRA